ncbi:MAG: fibronectin type III domain-containing protein [Bacteroidales bacterium]|nr:fibronectin type III domain-containing protein [Bacteroidales bacterium]
MFNRKLILLFLLSGLIFFSECTKPVKEMMVSTGVVTDIQINSAEVTGLIIDLGEGITEHGHCYAKSPNVSYTSLKTSLGVPGDTGLFISELHDLAGGTTYYIKAYVKNGNEYAYGKEKYFSTNEPSLPVISTTKISEITQTTALSGGNISSDGGAPVTASGVCWATKANPTIDNSITTDGTSFGSFSSILTGLSANTKYHVRAYATNSAGKTGYGDNESFTTL